MKALLALRGSMREKDRDHLLSLGYDVTFVDILDDVRQLSDVALRDQFAMAALSGNIRGGGFGLIASEAYGLADAMIKERAK